MDFFEPKRLSIGGRTFPIEYVQPPDEPNAWHAITHVVRDAHGTLHPAGEYPTPVGYSPPSMVGSGRSKREAFGDLKRRVADDIAQPYVYGEDPARIVPLLPYINFLPPPAEATLAALPTFFHLAASRELKEERTSQMILSALEAPSSRLACRHALAAMGLDDFEIKFQIPKVQEPDPRVPRRPVRFQVWDYRWERTGGMGRQMTTEPEPNLPPSSLYLRKAVAAIAVTPFDRKEWFRKAAELRASHEPTVEGLLGTMVHPAPAAHWEYAAELVQANQVVAALALAHFDRPSPWSTSLRREVLFDLLHGPLDWTVGAAIIALTALTDEEPAIGPEVFTAFAGLLDDLPTPGRVCYLHPLVCCMQQLPGVTRERAKALAEIQRQVETADRE